MEKINDTISIITIAFNCRNDLEKTIESVLAQDYPFKEYVVVDGDSTDGTDKLLEKYQDSIDVIISEPDDGIYDALNKGICKASGEWIICMNAGDTFTSPHVLTDILGKGISPDKSFIYSNFLLCNPDGTTQLREADRGKGEVHHQNAIYRRSLHKQYGYYIVTNPYIVSDLLFFLAIPETMYIKTSTIIANVKAGGISDNIWCVRQALAAKVVYGKETIPSIFFKDLRMRLSLRVKKLRCLLTFKKSSH